MANSRQLASWVSFICAVIGICLVGACSDDGGAPVAIDAAPMPDAAPIRSDVRGSGMVRYIHADGEVWRPRDFSGIPIAALVPRLDSAGNGSGAYEELVGSGDATGAFVIPNVPEGTYFLRFGESLYVETNARALVLNETHVGRSDQTPIQEPTQLLLGVQDMEPWAAGDTLSLYAPNAGAAFPSLERWLSEPPEEGASALAGSVDFAQAALPREIRSSAGDTALILHTRSVLVAAGVLYAAPVKLAESTSLAVTSGQPGAFSGSFVPLALDLQGEVSWDYRSFSTLATALFAGHEPDAIGAELKAVVYPFGVRSTYGEPALYAFRGNGLVLFQGATTSYSNPFPEGFAEHTVFTVSAVRDHAIGRRRARSIARIMVAGPAADVNNAELIPRQGPARSLTVDGRTGDAPIGEVGVTPELAWDPPLVGEVNHYVVTVTRYTEADSAFLQTAEVAQIFLTGTRLVLPAGILQDSGLYSIAVRAESHAAPDLQSRVFGDAPYALASAEQVSGLFSTSCGNGVCDALEAFSVCPADCPCGDGACDPGSESDVTCPVDCEVTVCGDEVCAGAETSARCPQDCGAVCDDNLCWSLTESNTSCAADCYCGDGICNLFDFEDFACAADCNRIPVCGDLVCDRSEDAQSCLHDCYCGDGVCTAGEICPSDCDGCGDGVCDVPREGADSCPGDCYCGDGTCDSFFENPDSCAADCICGDGVCSGGFEDDASCPADCSCGNFVCEPDVGEDPVSCPFDCYCGDGICQASGDEDPASCSFDCP